VNQDPRFHALLAAIEAELVLHLESDDPPKLEDGRGRFGPREVSSTLWGLANCGVTLKELAEHPTAPKILPLIAETAHEHPTERVRVPEHIQRGLGHRHHAPARG
jgi:hypothetical protein